MPPQTAAFPFDAKAARWAALLYLAVALIAPIGLLVVPERTFVAGDVAATAAAVRASETWLRLGIASDLLHQTIEIFLVLALYRLFAPVHAGWARGMALLGLLPIPIAFMNTLTDFAALLLQHGGLPAGALPAAQADALTYLAKRLHGAGLTVASVFWGGWLFPLAALAWRSRFGALARTVGVLTALAGLAYVGGAALKVLAPGMLATLGGWLMPLQSCELALIVWLLGLALRGPRPARGAAATG